MATTLRPSAKNKMKMFAALGLGIALMMASEPSGFAAGPVKRARPPQFSKSIRDAFFPDAREKLTGPRPTTREEASSTEAPLDEPSGRGSRGASQAWSQLISAEVIEDEIKSQQSKLGQAVQSATRFKGGDYQKARVYFSLLATLLAIDGQYDGTVRWQREAPAARDLMARAGFNCKVGTDASYKEAKERYEDLQNLVRGNSLEATDAISELSWPQVVDRPPLMKRLEHAQQQALVPWTANSGEFARRADKLLHEAELTAALAKVVAGEGYEFSDDASYREFAQAMQTQALVVRDAVQRKDYDQARTAVGEISKACTNCHEGFRN